VIPKLAVAPKGMASNGERLGFELFADALDGNGDIFLFHVGEGSPRDQSRGGWVGL